MNWEFWSSLTARAWLRVFHDATVKLPAREIWSFQWGQREYSQAHFYGCWQTSEDPPSSSLTEAPVPLQGPLQRLSEVSHNRAAHVPLLKATPWHGRGLRQESAQWVRWQSRKENVHVLRLEASGCEVIWVFAEITKLGISRLRDHSVLGLT